MWSIKMNEFWFPKIILKSTISSSLYLPCSLYLILESKGNFRIVTLWSLNHPFKMRQTKDRACDMICNAAWIYLSTLFWMFVIATNSIILPSIYYIHKSCLFVHYFFNNPKSLKVCRIRMGISFRSMKSACRSCDIHHLPLDTAVKGLGISFHQVKNWSIP